VGGSPRILRFITSANSFGLPVGPDELTILIAEDGRTTFLRRAGPPRRSQCALQGHGKVNEAAALLVESPLLEPKPVFEAAEINSSRRMREVLGAVAKVCYA
jgi:hypothetical protein